MKVYTVINEGEVVYASESSEEAESYAETETDKMITRAAEEMGIDMDDVDQVWKAQYQAGYDGGVYDVVEIDTDDFDENDEMEVQLDSGGEETIERYDVEQFLENNS